MRKNSLILLGLALTFILIAITVWIGTQRICNKEIVQLCDTNFEIFLRSPPNEKGDTLAGVAGSLAFLWIIITVLLQSSELALQRQELAQTRSTLEKQTGFLASQENERFRLSIDNLIETKIDTLRSLIHKPNFEFFDAVSKNENRLLHKHMSWITNKKRALGISTDEFISLLNTFTKNAALLRKKEIYLVPPNLKNWHEIRMISQEILSLADDSTPAMRDRIERIENIDGLNRILNEALSHEVWEVPEGMIAS